MRRVSLLMVFALLTALAVAPATSAQVKLEYWTGWMTGPHLEAEARILEAFMRENPDITVEIMNMTNPVEQVPIGHATGVIGDIVITSLDDFPNWQSMGAFRDVTGLLEADPGFAAEFVPQLLDFFQVGGRQYGLPFSSNGRGLTWYDTAVFAESGVAEPGLDLWSWDDVIENGRKMVRSDGNQTTQWGITIGTHPMTVYTWFWANDTDPWNADFTESRISDPRFGETIQYIHDLIHVSGVKRPPGVSGPYGVGTGAGPWNFQAWNENRLAGNYERRLMWNPQNNTGKRVAMVGGSGLAVSARSRHPQEALRLLQYLTSEEAQWIRFLEGYGTGSLTKSLMDAAQMEDSPIPAPQQLYWDVFTHGYAQPSFPRYREWAGILDRYLQQALRGEISIPEAVAHLDRETNLMLGR